MPEILLILIAAVVVIGVVIFLSGLRLVPNSRVGIVEKIFANKGSVQVGFIALNNEAGYQPKVLRGGWHIRAPFQYRVHLAPLVTIPQGQIGYVFARDGVPMHPTQTLGAVIPEGKTFQDTNGYLKHAGQRGPHRKIPRKCTNAFNTTRL